MSLKVLNENIFDGDMEAAYATRLSISIEDSNIQFELQELADFSALSDVIGSSAFYQTQTALGFEVIEFDGEKIFRGRKKGLRLFFLTKSELPHDIFLFSAGEFQHGRFQIFLEGCIKD